MKRNKRMAFVLVLLCALMMASTALAACSSSEDHRFGPWKVKRNPTCRETGLQFKYCTKCDHWEKRETAKLKHEADAWVVTSEPTCTKRGVENATCLLCGDQIKRYIDMIPHEYGEMVVTREPACTEQGRGEYVCTGCGKKKAENIAKLGHDWLITSVTKEPTCKEAGSGEMNCQRCGRTQTSQIDRLEHEWGEWNITREPDGKKKGLRVGVCALCGEERTEQFYWEGTLYLDMEPCEEVIAMQTMLRDLGYYAGSIRSGAFGELTGRAVGKFQKANGMQETEVADPQTLEMIESEWEKATGRSAETLTKTDMESAEAAQSL